MMTNLQTNTFLNAWSHRPDQYDQQTNDIL